MSESFHCRLCMDLKSVLEVVSIKEDGGINRIIFETVLTSFQVKLENSFPSLVCKDCWVQATAMYDLYQKVLRAQDLLQNVNQANIQIAPNEFKHPNIKVEIEDTDIHDHFLHHSIDVKIESDTEFGTHRVDFYNKEDSPSELQHAKIEENKVELGKENYSVGNKQDTVQLLEDAKASQIEELNELADNFPAQLTKSSLKYITDDVHDEQALLRRTKCKRDFCLFCKKLVTRIPRHLSRKHREEQRVKAFVGLPKNSAEKKRLITEIRREGNYIHNTNKNLNTGTIISCRQRRLTSKYPEMSYIHCAKCLGSFSKKNIRKHYAKCNTEQKKNSKVIDVKSRCAEGYAKKLDGTALKKDASLLKSRILDEPLGGVQKTSVRGGPASFIADVSANASSASRKSKRAFKRKTLSIASDSDTSDDEQPLLARLPTRQRAFVVKRRWTSPERSAVREFFGVLAKTDKLPSLSNCQKLIDQTPCLSGRKPLQIISMMQHQQRLLPP